MTAITEDSVVRITLPVGTMSQFNAHKVEGFTGWAIDLTAFVFCPADGADFEVLSPNAVILNGIPTTHAVNIADTAGMWVRIGTIDALSGDVLKFEIDAIRDNTGKSAPSSYTLTVAVNDDGGVSGVCYMGARLECIYGSDYHEGVSLDPIADFALVRRPGYDAAKADLLISLNGTSLFSSWRVSSPSDAFSLAVETGQSDPGTGTDTTHATRKFIYTV